MLDAHCLNDFKMSEREEARARASRASQVDLKLETFEQIFWKVDSSLCSALGGDASAKEGGP